MRQLLLYLFLLLICSTGQLNGQSTCQPYPGYRILIVGDSWSAILNENRFISTALSRAGYSDWKEKGDKTALAGSTASMWSDPAIFPIIRDELVQNPSIELVVLLIGGNDLLAGKFNNGWYVGMTLFQQNELYNRIEAQIRSIIAGMKAARPGLQILICGYDYINFVNTITDPLTLLSWDNLGQPTPRQINEAVLALEQRKVNIANEDPDVHYMHNMGRMQYMYGYDGFFGPKIAPLPGNTPPSYTPFPGGFIDFPTPKIALGGDGTDPIHLSDDGYSEIAKQMVEIYFSPKLKAGVNATYKSKGLANDGYVKPNNTKSNASLRMGREAAGNYRNIITFSTGALPDNAVVNKATLFITRSGSTLIGLPRPLDQMVCQLDIKKGFFGTKAALENVDYNAAASASNVGCFIGAAGSNGGKFRIEVAPSALQYINTKGNTQFRFYINETLSGTVYTSFYDGDVTTAANKPALEITYSLPGREAEQTLRVTPDMLEENEYVKIYPNPVRAGGPLQVVASKTSSYMITDLLGRICAAGTVMEGDNTILLPGSLSPGMFLLTFKDVTAGKAYPVILVK